MLPQFSAKGTYDGCLCAIILILVLLS